MLAYYAERFPTVEINNTFYRMPAPEQLRKWARRDARRLPLRAQEPTPDHAREEAGRRRATRSRGCYEAAGALGAEAGAGAVPAAAVHDARTCPGCRRSWPTLPARRARPAFEFRHESWFSRDVYEALRARDAALCIAEAEDLATPLEATAGWGYLRLRRQDYDDADAGRLGRRASGAQGWDDAFVFFKHEDEGRGPSWPSQLIQHRLGDWRRRAHAARRIGLSRFFVACTHLRVQLPTWRAQSQAERSPSGWSPSR